MIQAAIATLVIGLVIGYLGQRSGICFIGGIRDLFLFRDSYLLKGLFGLFVGGLIGFVIFGFLGGNVPNFLRLTTLAQIPASSWILTIIGGLGLGFFSVLAGGCPFRLHVMASEGRKDAVVYMIGFYLGIIYFYIISVEFVRLVVGSIL